MTTTHVKATDTEERWFLYDASKHHLGRMATRIATKLMGKDLPTYTASELCGAHVVVINAKQVQVSGRKSDQKTYGFYSGYPDGLKTHDMDYMRDRRPNDLVTLAVRRMLPKNRLGRDMLRLLKVYPDADHAHTAQKPLLVEEL